MFSPKEFTKYHANIVERFCLDKGLEGGYDAEGKRYSIADRSWSVEGGGKFELDGNKKTIKLSDSSMAYGEFDRAWMGALMRALPEFTGFAVQIE